MKVQYASDLHLSVISNKEAFRRMNLTPSADFLVLIGDITEWHTTSLDLAGWFWNWCSKNYKQTYIVPGNHEYYRGVDIATSLPGYERKIRENVTYLNNRSIIIDGVEIFFTTLWPRPKKEEFPQSTTYDMKHFKIHGRDFRFEDYAQIHACSTVWLDKALSESTALKKVVATHFVPSYQFVPEKYKGAEKPQTSNFNVDMDPIILKCRPDYWIYGHNHANLSDGERIGDTVFLTNQFGNLEHCKPEGANFRYEACIEL